MKHRRNVGEISSKNNYTDDLELTATQRKILKLLKDNPEMTGTILAEKTRISKRNIEANIRKLKDLGVLYRHGSARAGFWEILIKGQKLD